MSEPAVPSPLVLYDGDCGFCAWSVGWILARDPAGRFHFAPLQGETTAALRAAHPDIPTDVSTLVLLDDGRVWVRSRAVFRLLSWLPAPWRWLAVLRVLPAFATDLGYRAIARIRKRLMPNAACRIPSADERRRFLP